MYKCKVFIFTNPYSGKKNFILWIDILVADYEVKRKKANEKILIYMHIFKAYFVTKQNHSDCPSYIFYPDN